MTTEPATTTTDAPMLTHCPSCGTELSAEPEIHRRNCEQCDRDLELPEQAIKHQLCLLCKIPEKDSDDAVEYHTLDTGERLCSNCLADLRAFKFDLAYQVFIAEFLPSGVSEAITGTLFKISEKFGLNHSEAGNTNAAHGRVDPSPEDDAIDATLEDLDDEQRAELRNALEASDASEVDGGGSDGE